MDDVTGKAQDEPAESTRLQAAEQVSAGRSLPAERQKAVIGSFEPLIDSVTAAELLKVHRKTLERMALRGEFLPWRYSPISRNIEASLKLAPVQTT